MQENDVIFNNNNYKFISDLVEKNLPLLRQNKDFNEKYIKLTNLIENLDKHLDKQYKEDFNEIIKLFYETEEYYFALSYSLGVKYSNELKKL